MTASILVGSRYQPARGGHAPGDLREAFGEAVEAFHQWETGKPEPTVELRDQAVPIGVVFGLLWNCTDTMPHSLLVEIDDGASMGNGVLKSGTYSAGSRYLMSEVKRLTA